LIGFLQDFRASAARTALELRVACATRQTKAAAEAAHKLKSSALAVGALALGELSAAMEEEGNAGDGDALTVLLPRFETEMAAVEKYLASLWERAPVAESAGCDSN
jgi:two-component system sensor histidine kinase/response regulator